MKVILVDDHQLVLNGFKKILEDLKCDVLATFTDPKQALSPIINTKPDVVFTDLDMPGMNGAELISQVREQSPEQKFILVTMHLNQQVVKKMLSLDVNAYLTKNAHLEELEQALQAVAGGRTYYTPEVVQSLAFKGESMSFSQNPVLTPALSKREREVLQLIAMGESTKSIAEKLFLSTGTIESHRRAIMHKLNVSNVAGMVRIAVQEGLV
ncbi:MAG: response regulator transcription factor [Owenweeksia sp.]|nr:response regulator transcription factor [Owenweeksia sp.]